MSSGSASSRCISWGRRYPRHTPAHQERYCIPLQCRRHQDDCLCRRKRYYRPHHGCHARLSECEEAGQRRPEIAEGFEDFHKGIADAAPFAPAGASQQQRRYFFDVLHQRHYRRTQNGGARLHVSIGAHRYRKFLAQPARKQPAPHHCRYGLG